jgi:hypothetical protein
VFDGRVGGCCTTIWTLADDGCSYNGGLCVDW